MVPDQLVDRTQRRVGTFYDHGAVHVSFADSYCPAGAEAIGKAAAADMDYELVMGATMVVIEGPRFSSRAESQWYASASWSLVNMTGMPESALARELALCYTSLALVTDFDAGIGAHESVNQADVLAVFAKNIRRLRELVAQKIERLPPRRDCPCPAALDGLHPSLRIPG